MHSRSNFTSLKRSAPAAARDSGEKKSQQQQQGGGGGGGGKDGNNAPSSAAAVRKAPSKVSLRGEARPSVQYCTVLY